MEGNVLVDDVEREEPPVPRLPAVSLVGLGAAVLFVLALLPGQSDETPTESTSDVAPVTVAGGWEPTHLPGAGRLEDVIRLADGSYLTVGDGPQAWRYDGESAWSWQTLPGAAPGSLAAVTEFGSGAVAVGAEETDGSTPEATIWSTGEGESWRRVVVEREVPSALEGVVGADGHLLAWGWAGSERAFAPEAEALLLRSSDGRSWTEVEDLGVEDGSSRIFTVAPLQDRWYAGGYAIGRPALWESTDDRREWKRVDTGDLPFGWGIVDVRSEGAGAGHGSLVATLVHLSEGRARRWVRAGGTWDPIDDRSQDVVIPVDTADGPIGVGSGRLWRQEEGEWRPVPVEGEVTAAAGRVAVGTGPTGQPLAWVRNGHGVEGTSIPMGTGGRWEPRRVLREPEVPGAWRVAGGWVLGGTDEGWTFLGPDGEETFPPPWGSTFSTIAPVGDEWVALPSMHWSGDGVHWEQRAHPWTSDGSTSQVEAVAEVDGQIRALGRDVDYRWNAAVSSDRGRSWSSLGPPVPADPMWAVAGIPNGFVATAGRSSGRAEVVTSRDGREWEPVAAGRLLPGVQPPAALTSAGELVLFDTGERTRPPRIDIAALARTQHGLAVVAGGRMWVSGEEWAQIPLDPPHGMGAGWVLPLPLGDRLLALGKDHQRTLLYEWNP